MQMLNRLCIIIGQEHTRSIVKGLSPACICIAGIEYRNVICASGHFTQSGKRVQIVNGVKIYIKMARKQRHMCFNIVRVGVGVIKANQLDISGTS